MVKLEFCISSNKDKDLKVTMKSSVLKKKG